MLELLKDRVSNYSYDKAIKFRNQFEFVDPNSLAPSLPLSTWGFPENTWGFMQWVIVFHNKTKNPLPMWERVENGDLIYSDDTAVFFGDDSHIHKLSRTHLEHDWLMHNELHDLVSKNNDLRIEIPIHGEKISLPWNDYWYTEVQRPNHTTLMDIHQVHHVKKLNSENLYKILDQTLIYLNYVKQVNSKHQLGCPDLGINLSKFKADSDGPFNGIWTDIKHWSVSFEKYVSQTYANVYHYLDDHRDKEVIPHHEVRPLLNYMLEKYKTLGVQPEIIQMVEYDLSNIQVCDQVSKPKNYYE